MIAWKLARFDELDAREVHDILQARSAVFVVEQDCVFQDVDGADPFCWHLVGRGGSPSRLAEGRGGSPSRLAEGRSGSPSPLGEGRGEGRLLAYCRLVPAGTKFPEASIGRVLTTAEGRRKGLGRELMAEALRRAHALWPGQPLRIGAQQYLETFYGEFGFARCSEPYDEDGIIHIEMLKR